MPVQFKTLRLSKLKDAKLIQFEEYEPFNCSNRNENQITGGRLTSQASNSNKHSFSKTFNFQMAFLGNNDDNDNISQQETNKLQESQYSEKEQVQKELTQRVDEKIRQIAEEYSFLTSSCCQQQIQKSNMGTQTFVFNEIMNENDIPTEPIQMIKSQSLQKEPINRMSILQDSARDEEITEYRNNTRTISQGFQKQTLEQTDQKSKNFNQTMSKKRTSQCQNKRLFDRMSSTQNRTQSSSVPHSQNIHSTSNVQDNIQNSTTTIIHNKQNQQVSSISSDQKVNHSHHERQWSQSSSSNKNQNNSQPFNGFSSFNFNRTMGPSQITSHFTSNSKKKEEHLIDLKYMLENVQCEAKNLKLLLNLKDDQLQMYEAKSQELAGENEELLNRLEDKKQRIEQIEEENLYLKAIVNSQGTNQNFIKKQNASVSTEMIQKYTQQCQATFPQVKISYSMINNVGLSPIKEQKESPDKISQQIENLTLQNSLKLKLQDSEKENINLMNTLEDYKAKLKIYESDNSLLQNQFFVLQKENQEMKKQLQQENKSLYWQVESSLQQLSEREKQMKELVQHLEEQKHQTKKKSSKIKNLKKERDNLKIEILKLKQIYSDKCDNYRDIRHKLQRKLKKREDIIGKLEEKIIQYEKHYKRQMQGSNKGTINNNPNSSSIIYPEWSQNYHGTTGKFGQDLESSQLFRSSMSSRSLENTRNLNSTAKNNLRGLNQLANKNENGREISQHAKDMLLGSNQQHNTSLSNPPKQKNLTPGSLPSGSGVHCYNYFQSAALEEVQREKGLQKLKSHYKKLELEDKKMMNQKYQQYLPSSYKGITNQNHYVSNDKSKSFYSSDIENNPLFDQNHIVPMEDQSNSSNFFSNINNSNSLIFMDDSVVIKDRYLEFQNHQYAAQKQAQKRLTRIASNNNIKEKQQINDIMPMTNGPQVLQYYQREQFTTGNNQQQPIKKVKPEIQQQMIVSSYLSSIQPEDNQNQMIQKMQAMTAQQQQQSQFARGFQSKSPLNEMKYYQQPVPKNTNTNTTKNYDQSVVMGNKSAQNISLGEQQNNTQTLRQARNDSATSSNRNLHQVKETVRPPSTSSTNNTSGFYNNQVAMVSYQSSSSGGSKQQQQLKQNQNQTKPQIQSYIPMSQFSQKCTSQQHLQFTSQNAQNNKQLQVVNSSFNEKQPSTMNQQHRRQRSRQVENEMLLNEYEKYQLLNNQNDLKNYKANQNSFNY